MDGCTVVIEAAGEPDAFTDIELARFARELASTNATMLSAADRSRYGAVIVLSDVEEVREAFALAIGRFGSALEFAGLRALPIARVEVIHWEAQLTGRDPATPAPRAS
jgi:hypothetical protein